MSFTIVTYWWGRGKQCKNAECSYEDGTKTICCTKNYEHLAQEWVSQMKKFKIPYYIEEKPEFSRDGKYQDGISYKPKFIESCMKKLNTPIIYMDMDMKIHKFPKLFNNNFFDIMLFNWNCEPRVTDVIDYFTVETSGGLFYFNNTKTATKILKLWYKELLENKGKADDRIFSMMFKKYDIIDWCRCYWIPMEYFYIPQFQHDLINKKDVVISHPYSITTEYEAYKLGACRNRIPKQYDKIVQINECNDLTEMFNYYFKSPYEKKLYLPWNNYMQNNNIKKLIPISVKRNSNAKCRIKNKIKNSELDIVFDKNFNVMYCKPSLLTLKLLENIDDLKNKRNITYVLGTRYLIA